MISFDDNTKENIKEHNPDQPQILDQSYRILIAGGSGSKKKKTDIDNFIYMLQIHMKQNINCALTKEKVEG